MTNLMTGTFADRITLLKILLFWINLPRGRGKLIHLPESVDPTKQATLYT